MFVDLRPKAILSKHYKKHILFLSKESFNIYSFHGIGASDWSKMFRIPAPKHFVESTFLNCYDLTLFIEREVPR